MIFGALGVRDLVRAETPRERLAAAVGLAIMIATLGLGKVISGKKVTVLGSRRDCLTLKDVPGFEVLDVPDAEWSPALNRAWLAEGVERGDVIMLRTDPVKFGALMKEKGTSSVLLDLELPMLQDEYGFFRLGPFMVRW